MIISADKTRNFYRVEREQYLKMLEEDITKDYKKSSVKKVQAVNAGAAAIAAELGLDDRMQVFRESEAFITIKDHKPSFPSKVSRRLLNGAKTDIGVVSKHILQEVIKNLLSQTKLNSWQSTGQCLEWYKNLEKGDLKFLIYDIENYYPSISESLLDEAITFAKLHCEITEEQISHKQCRI